jgi:F0F1-type ATP synthase epsilon subunit
VREASGTESRWQVAGGFFEVSNNTATVLADAVSTA